jgi:hypothetical protein
MFLVRAAFWILVVVVFAPLEPGVASVDDTTTSDTIDMIRSITIERLNRVKQELLEADRASPTSTPPSNDVQSPGRAPSPPRAWFNTAYLGAVFLFPKRL